MKASLRVLLLGCLLKSLTSSAQTYCQPTYSGIGGGSGTYIDGFVLGTINNLGAGPTALPGYADYTNTGLNSVTTVVPGSTNSATIFLGPASELTQYAIWVDLDRDHVYGPTEQLAYQLVESDTASVTLSITIPADAQRGYTGMRVLCTSIGDDANDPCGVMVIGETEDYTLVIDDGAPCIPVFGYGPSELDYIDGVVFGAINNTGSGGFTGEAYSNLMYSGADHITSVQPGSSVPMSITAGGSFSDYYSVWVDVDQDGSFQPGEKLAVATNSIPGQTLTLNVVIPADALPGYTRMRVMCVFLQDPGDACGTFDYGEAEDYTLVIDDGAPCIPVYAYGTTNGILIDGVVFGTINNIGSGSTTGSAYSSYLNAGQGFITSVAPGGSYPMTITSGPYDPSIDPIYYTVWVDLDRNGTFDPAEKLATNITYDAGANLPLTVDIPVDASPGYTRIRVMCTHGVDPTEACGSLFRGETEDYTLVIDDGSPCIPVFGYQASEGDYVSDVQLEDLNWTVPTIPPIWGYEDATRAGAHLQADVTSQLTVTKGTFAGGNHLYVWIDWSNDGFDAFDLLGTQVVSGSGGTATFDVTPPATPGYARMRIACTYAELNDACGVADYGHAVDFTLSIGRVGWPCLPLLGWGTQGGDGFANLAVQGNAYTVQTDFPYYDWSASTPYHWEQGGSYGVSFETGTYIEDTYRVYMDMNDDGDFSDADEVLATASNSTAGQLMAMPFTIPANCPPGQHFMRLRANDDANYPLVDQCDDKLYGQIVDWVVAVQDPNGPCMTFVNTWTTGGDFIDGVQLGTIENLSTGGSYGAAYHDYTTQSADLMVGQVAPLFITGGEVGGNTYSAWIDYNSDNDFGDADESLGSIGIADPYATELLIFNVPPGTLLGNKRMRVRCAPTALVDACATTNTGETEDYTVNIEVNTGVLAATIAELRVLPTIDGVQLLTDAAYIGHTYTLFDATGRTLSTGRITSDRTDLPMIDFARGGYTVYVLDGDARQVKRFVW